MPGTAWKRWNWLDDGLVPLSIVLMHVACIAPIYAALLRDPSTGIQSTGFVFWLCLGVMLGGAIVGRMASRNSMGAFIVIVGALAACLIALLLAIPPDAAGGEGWLSGVLYQLTHPSLEALPVPLVTVLFVVLLWWRGLRTIQVEHERLVRLFVAGLAVQLILLFAGFSALKSARQAGHTLATPQELAMLGRVLLFLASSMAAFSFTQISDTLREQGRQTGVRLHPDRYWAATVLSVIAGLLLLGLIAGQILAPGWLGLLRPLWNAVVHIFLLILLVLSYLFFGLLEPLFRELSSRPRTGQPFPFLSPLGLQGLEEIEQSPVEISPLLLQILQIAAALVGLALVIWLLVRTLRRRQTQSEIEGVIESRESVLSWELVKSQVSSLLDGLRKKRLDPFLSLEGGPDDPRRIVRALYQQILARAAGLASPRERGETPETYMQKLLHLCPDEGAAWEAITAAYEIARYGDVPPTAEQVRAAQEAYARVDIALQKKKMSSVAE